MKNTIQNIAGKLLGTTNSKLARRIGKRITLKDITRGRQDARVNIEKEKTTLGVLLIVSYNGDLYEVEQPRKSAV